MKHHLTIILILALTALTTATPARLTNAERQELAILSSTGQQSSLDSLFTAYDKANRLEPFDYLQWAQLKNILTAYSAMGDCYCTAALRMPQLAELVKRSLAGHLRDASRDTVRVVISNVVNCLASPGNTDTIPLRLWAYETYASHELYPEAIQVLLRFSSPLKPAGRELSALSRTLFVRQIYATALAPAISAYAMLSGTEQSECAALICQIYTKLGHNDSALVWIKKASLSRGENRIAAISLYQQTSLMSSSDSLIKLLPPSIAADTLIIRQHWFTGDTLSARKYAATLMQHLWWRGSLQLALLWQVRSMLYSGNTSAAGMLLDSVAINPAAAGAAELLDCKYTLLRLSQDPAAASMYGSILYALFLQHPEQALLLLKSGGSAVATINYVAATMVRNPLILKNSALFDSVIAACNTNDLSAELIFFSVRQALERGNRAAAVALYKQLMQRYPHDVFSQKARLLMEQPPQ